MLHKYIILLTLMTGLAFQQGNAQVYDFNGIPDGASGTLTNGWTCNPSTATAYRWQAETGAAPGLSTGPDQPYAGSAYMVINSGNATTTSTEAFLTSPAVNITGYTNPGFGFWYHLNGASFGGPLKIEASTNGSTWTVIDSINAPVQTNDTMRWRFKRLSLAAFSSTTAQVRFVATPGGALRASGAIDLCSFVEMPAQDAGFDRVSTQFPYFSMPRSQIDSIILEADITNYGHSPYSNVSYSGTFITSSSGPVTLSSGSHNVNSGSTVGIQSANSYVPSGEDTLHIEYILDPDPADTFALNDTLDHTFVVSDSVYARDGGEFAGGIGFTALAGGQFGQMFTIYNTDTLTSIDVRLQGPTQGDSIRFYLFQMSGGTPSTLIDSSDILEIPSSAADWYNVNFSCESILAPDDYFFAVEQMNTNNLSFGFTQEYYEPNVCFYRANTATAWTPFEAAGFQVVLGIRPIFGTSTGNQFSVDIGADTNYCSAEGISHQVDAYVFAAAYNWNTGDTTPDLTIDTAGTYIVTVSKCGVSQYDTVEVIELQSPDVDLGPDDFYCGDEPFSRSINFSTPAADYMWHDNSTSSSYLIDTAGTYSVTAELNGCHDSATVQISHIPLLDPIDLGNDTSYCEGESFGMSLDAGNPGADHFWSNGGNLQSIFVSSADVYSVTVTQGGLCPDTISDTIAVIEAGYPEISLSDTYYCTGSAPLILNPGGGYEAYSWSTGDTTPTLPVTSGGIYAVTVTNEYGCESTTSSDVQSRAGTSVDLGPDIADTNTSVTLSVTGNYAGFLWSTGATVRTITVDSSGTYWIEVTANNDCRASDTVNVDIHYYDTTGIAEHQIPDLNIYPNPAREFINITSSAAAGSYDIALYSVSGSLLKNTRHSFGESDRIRISTSGLSSGIYLLKISSENKHSVTKIIIE